MPLFTAWLTVIASVDCNLFGLIMSTSNIQNENNTREKFTRGEKCIFIHLVLTFVLILIVVLIYLIHLYAIDHTVYDVFKTRRSFDTTRNLQIGMAYIKPGSPVAVCNTILFTTSWSIAPGHCVSMRSEPDMDYVVSLWRIKYTPANPDEDDLKIIRTVLHPLFMRASLAHNIGLFHHEAQDTRRFLPLTQPLINAHGDKNIFVGSWSESAFKEKTRATCYPIKIIERDRCYKMVSFIENIREYEYCAAFSEKHDTVIEHGALVMEDNRFIGIFSWGDKNGKVLPFVILNISNYRNWIRQQTSNLEIDENL